MRDLRIFGLGFLVSLLLLGTCGSAQRAKAPIDASLIQLISDPDKYDGKLVRVIGFLRLEFEGDALYLHQEDDARMLTKNAVWIDATAEMTKNSNQLNMKYVLLEGTFDAKHFGHMGLFSGTIHQITRAEPWPFRKRRDKAKQPKN